MSDLLFAVPWWLFISLIIVGGVVFWSGNNRGQKNPQYIGVALIVLAIGLKTLSFFVETDKEKVARQTTELVKCVQTRDWSKFESLLDPDVSLNVGGSTLFSNSQAMVDGAKADCERYTLTSASCRVTSVVQDEAGITVDIDAFSEASMGGMSGNVPSSWKLIWDRTGKEWHLHEITCLRIMQDKSDQMKQLIK